MLNYEVKNTTYQPNGSSRFLCCVYGDWILANQIILLRLPQENFQRAQIQPCAVVPEHMEHLSGNDLHTAF